MVQVELCLPLTLVLFLKRSASQLPATLVSSVPKCYDCYTGLFLYCRTITGNHVVWSEILKRTLISLKNHCSDVEILTQWKICDPDFHMSHNEFHFCEIEMLNSQRLPSPLYVLSLWKDKFYIFKWCFQWGKTPLQCPLIPLDLLLLPKATINTFTDLESYNSEKFSSFPWL